MDKGLISSPEPDQSLAETRTFWHETGKLLIRESIATIDAAARQVIVVAGILEGLYFHAVTFTGLRGQAEGWSLVLYLLPVVLLLVSLTASLMVFLPDRYRLSFQSAEACKLFHERVVRGKLRALRIGSLFLILGVAAIIGAIALYLVG
jgi:uncharacterized membrane protein YtjA (UPF0391 family)